jgi:hypothetical protein
LKRRILEDQTEGSSRIMAGSSSNKKKDPRVSKRKILDDKKGSSRTFNSFVEFCSFAAYNNDDETCSPKSTYFLPIGSPYTSSISSAILKLQEKGRFLELKTRWWKEMNEGAGNCDVSEQNPNTKTRDKDQATISQNKNKHAH